MVENLEISAMIDSIVYDIESDISFILKQVKNKKERKIIKEYFLDALIDKLHGLKSGG